MLLNPNSAWLAVAVAGAAAAQALPTQQSTVPYQPLSGAASLVGEPGGFSPSGDEELVPLPLPFAFPFYGASYTTVSISENGLLAFGACVIGCNDGGKIPDPARAVHAFIAPWWDDLELHAGVSDIVYRSTPTRVDVEWRRLFPYRSTASQLTFTVTLYASGAFAFHYGPAPGAGGSASAGYENASGSQGASLLPCSSGAAACNVQHDWNAGALYLINQPLQADLAVEHVGVASIARSGGNLVVDVSATFANLGRTAATGFVWKVWLSPDGGTGPGSTPVLTTSSPLSAPANGTVSDSASATVAVPPGTTAWLLVEADPMPGVVTEGSEGNNLGRSLVSFHDGVDLDAFAVSGPESSGPGEALTVAATYGNRGTQAAGTVAVELSLSGDAGEVLLYSGTRALVGGQWRDEQLSVTVPASAPNGDFAVRLKVGPAAEARSPAPVRVRDAELFVESAALAGLASFGSTSVVHATIVNSGGAAARNFHVAVAISRNANLSLLTDTEVGDLTVPLLAPGESRAIDLPAALPLADGLGMPFTSGTWFVFVLVDSKGTVRELDELNDALSLGAVFIHTPAPDLTVTWVSAPPIAAAGEAVAVQRVIANTGTVAAPNARYRWFASANPDVTPADTPLDVTALVTLAPGATDTRTEVVRLPPTLTAGTWFIGCYADVDQAIAELDEDDNGRASLPVTVSPGALRMSTPELSDAIAARPYAFVLGVSGGDPNAPVTWTLDAAGGLPAGLQLSSDGLLSGTALTPAVAAFTVIATRGPLQAAARLVLRVVPTEQHLEITTASLLAAVVARRYEASLGAAGGLLPYRWSIAAGALPGGLSLDADTGRISGVASAESTAVVGLKVVDAQGTQVRRQLTLRVVPQGAMVFTTTTLPAAIQGQGYGVDIPLGTTDGRPLALPLKWSVVAGALPSGLTISGSGGAAILDGTPAMAGDFELTVEAEDANGARADADFRLRVFAARLDVVAPELPAMLHPLDTADFDVGVAGRGDVTLALFSGALPEGLSLDPSGHVSGTVAAAAPLGPASFMVEARDAAGATGLAPFTIEVATEPARGACGCGLAGGAPLWALALLLGTARRRRIAVLLALAVPLAARAFEYEPAGPTMSPYPSLVSGVAVAAGAPLTLPFAFALYGQPVSRASMTMHGYLDLAQAGPGTTANPGIPHNVSTLPVAFIAPWWDALSAESFELTWQTLGSAPSRRAVFQWHGQHADFQVALYEQTGQIRLHWGGTAPPGASASAGVQGQAGVGQAVLACTTPAAGLCTTASYPAGSALDLFVPADLRIDAVSAPPLGYAGVGYPVTVRVANAGGRAALSAPLTLFLSRDAVLDASDVSLVQPSVDVPARDAVTVVAQPALPATAAGAWYLLTRVGASQQGPATRLDIGPPTADLWLPSVTAPATAAPGQVVSLMRTLQNRGNAAPGPLALTWFVSDNAVISISDRPLAVAATVAGPAPGASDTQTEMLALPADLPAGEYWLGACVNYDSRQTPPFPVAEINLNDDCACAPAPTVIASGTLAVITGQLAEATRRAPFAQHLVAAGGNGRYSWAPAPGAQLPLGLSLTAAGDLYGEPGAAGSFAFEVQVISGSTLATRQLTLSVGAGDVPLVVVDQQVPGPVFGRAFSAGLIAVGGAPPYVWTLAAGSALPLGLALSPDGALEGRALESGMHRFTVEAGDSAGARAAKELGLYVAPADVVRVATERLAVAVLERDYVQPLEAVGGAAPFTWSVLSTQRLPQDPTEAAGAVVDGLPAELGLVVEREALRGQPRQAGLFALTLRVDDGEGARAVRTVLLTVSYRDALAITTTVLPDAFAGQAYSARLSHNRGQQSAGVRFSAPCLLEAQSAGAFSCIEPGWPLPAGLALSEDGALSGQATGPPGTYPFLVKVADAAGRTDVRSLSIRVRAGAGGTGCSQAGLAPVAVSLLALWGRRRRRRH